MGHDGQFDQALVRLRSESRASALADSTLSTPTRSPFRCRIESALARLAVGIVSCVATGCAIADRPYPQPAKSSVNSAPSSHRRSHDQSSKNENRRTRGMPERDTQPRSAMADTDLLHCDLSIEISEIDTVEETCRITGINRMAFKSKSPRLTELALRLDESYVITNALLNDTTPVEIDTVSSDTRILALDRIYGMDEHFTITIEYDGVPFSGGLGSIRVEDQDGRPVVATLSEPFFAHTWWPVKDGERGMPGDNSDKFTLDFSVTVPSPMLVPANGRLISVDELSHKRRRFNWSSKYPIATYLVSFAASQYNSWAVPYVHAKGTMPVEFYIYPDLDTPKHRAAWERSIDMLRTFEALFGEYPFLDEKYGIYNFPFRGGMEHQTIAGQGGFSEAVTAHEVAHQWWGDLVSCKTWSDLWLNEGMATYSECLWKEFRTGQSDPAALSECMVSRTPRRFAGSAYVYPEDLDRLRRVFSISYTYRKSAWVFHQLRHLLGDAAFFALLSDYRATYANSAASTAEFVALASSAYGQDLNWFFDQWVFDIGAPAYRFAWDTVHLDGQQWLHIRLSQTQSAKHRDVFVTPVEFAVEIDGEETILTVWNDRRTQYFVLPVEGEVTSVALDPDSWLLKLPSSWIAKLFAHQNMYLVGDLDGDKDVDRDDADAFANCLTATDGATNGPVIQGCEPADFDGDGLVSCHDWSGFVQAWTQPGEPPAPTQCGGNNAQPTMAQWGDLVLTITILTAGTVLLQ